jgi:hypothetical protein
VRAPWVANDQRAQCRRCNRAFSPTLQRHHCSSCGEIYCDVCSSGRTVVGIPVTEPGQPAVDLSNGKVRACTQCFDQITADGLGG